MAKVVYESFLNAIWGCLGRPRERQSPNADTRGLVEEEYIPGVDLDEYDVALDPGYGIAEATLQAIHSAEEKIPEENVTDSPPGGDEIPTSENDAETLIFDQHLIIPDNASQAGAPDAAQPIVTPCAADILPMNEEQLQDAGSANDDPPGQAAASSVENAVSFDKPGEDLAEPQVPDTLREGSEPTPTPNDVDAEFAFPPANWELPGACGIDIPAEHELPMFFVNEPNDYLFQAEAFDATPLPEVIAEHLKGIFAQLELENEIVPCIASFAPGAHDCSWRDKRCNMTLHLTAEHQPNFLHTDEMVLEPTKHKVLHCFDDFFVCYATFHHRDLICVVEHACPCDRAYAYRCILISENQTLPHLSGNVRLALNELKDFKLLRKHPRVTRFLNNDVEPRKNAEKKISVWIKIFRPSAITEAEEGKILLSENDDLPHLHRNIHHAKNEEKKYLDAVIHLKERHPGTNERDDQMGILVTNQEFLSFEERSRREKAITCPLIYVPGNHSCNWSGSKEFLFTHMMRQHEEHLQHTNNVLLEERMCKVLHFLNEIFVCYVAKDGRDISCVVQHAAKSSCSYSYRCFLVSVNQDLPHAISDVQPVLQKVQEHRVVRKLPHVVRFKQPDVAPRKFGGNRICVLFQICPSMNALRPDIPRNDVPHTAEEEEKEYFMVCALNEAYPSRRCPWIGRAEGFCQHFFDAHRGFLLETRSTTVQPMQCGILLYSQCSFFCYCTYEGDDLVCTVWSAPTKGIWLYKCTLLSGTEAPEIEAPERHVQIFYKTVKLMTDSRSVTRFTADEVKERKSSTSIIEVKFTIRHSPEMWPRCLTREEKDNQAVGCMMNGKPGATPCPWMGLWKSFKHHLEYRHAEEYYSDYYILLKLNKCRILAAYSDVFICYAAFDGKDLVCRVYHACPCERKFPFRVTLVSEDRSTPDFEPGMRYLYTEHQTFQQIEESPCEVRIEAAIVKEKRPNSVEYPLLLEVFPAENDENRPPLFLYQRRPDDTSSSGPDNMQRKSDLKK